MPRRVAPLVLLIFGFLLVRDLTEPAREWTPIERAQAANVDFGATVKVNAAHAVTATTQGFATANDRLGTEIRARFTITCVLPAYTASGTMAGGNRVFTANANGALSTSCTDGVTAATNDVVLVAYNDTATTDAGIFTLTATGSGGAPWVLTQTSTEGLNTAARLQGSTVRVLEGFEAGLWACRQNTITLGTTPLLWRRPVPPDSRHGYYANAQFSEQGAQICSTAVNSGVTQYAGFGCLSTGTAARVLNTATGEGGFETGTATTGTQRLISGAANMALARYEIEYGVRWSVGTASDGTNTYTVNFGIFGDANNFSRIVLTPTAGANITHVTTVASVAGATRTLCTGCFATSTIYRYVLRKPFGATTYEIWFDPGTGVLAYNSDTPAIATTNQDIETSIIKSAGATGRTLTVYEQWVSFYDPKAFGG